MPYPKEGESKDAYISRCIPYVMHEDPDMKQDHAAAKCYGMWDQSKKSESITDKIDKYLNEEDKGEEEKRVFTTAKAKEIGDKLDIKWDKWDVEQFRMGMDVELEHGTVSPATNVTDDDPIPTGKIALAHLNEINDYYTRLAKMEKEGKEDLKESVLNENDWKDEIYKKIKYDYQEKIENCASCVYSDDMVRKCKNVKNMYDFHNEFVPIQYNGKCENYAKARRR